jgi:hypothetical protein
MRSTEGTIKIQRKSIHRKLEIVSQAELFALFIRCIPYAEPGKQRDPLEAYREVDRAQSSKSVEGQSPGKRMRGTAIG